MKPSCYKSTKDYENILQSWRFHTNRLIYNNILTLFSCEKPFYPDSSNKSTFITGTWINKWSEKFFVNDTLIIYLSTNDIYSEVEELQNRLRKRQ